MANEEVREQNIKKVLETAVQCFMKYGIEATTFSKVAHDSRLSVRSVQRYFESKEALVSTALDYYLNLAFSNIVAIMSTKKAKDKSKTAIEQIIYYFQIQLDSIKQSLDSILLNGEMIMYFTKKEDCQPLYEKHMQQLKVVRKILYDQIARGIAEGTIRNDIDVDVAGTMLSVSYAGLLQRSAVLFHFAKDEAMNKLDKLYQEYFTMVRKYLANNTSNLA